MRSSEESVGVGVKVLLLRGAPGVGKSTVGRLLAGLLGDGAICEVDRFRAMFAGVDWGSRQQHEMALRAAIAACRSLLEDGVSPVVAVSYTHLTLPTSDLV